MGEIWLFILVIMFAGYYCVSFLFGLLGKIRYNFNIGNYGLMLFYMIYIPLIPIFFVLAILGVGLGVELLFTLTTGHI